MGCRGTIFCGSEQIKQTISCADGNLRVAHSPMMWSARLHEEEDSPTAMKRLSHNRNGTEIFALRSRKNLEYITNSAINGEDVHPVTQAILALLGIVVFPWETSAFDIVKKHKLPVLSGNGWPKWKMSGVRRVIELGDLIEVLRHAIAHGNIEFDSDSSSPAEVTISFTNIPRGKKDSDWVGSITGDQLIEFCRRFSSAMKEQVG